MKNILAPYILLAEFLSQTLGENYEIVVQQVTGDNVGVIHIINGHITNRAVGAPLTDLAQQWIAEKTYLEHDSFVNYQGKINNDQTVIKSSTLFIKNDKSELIGMLCINCNVSAYTHLINELLINAQIPLDLLNIPASLQTLDIEQLSDSMASTINSAKQNNGLLNKKKLTHNDRLKVIRDLFQGSFFQIKGSITEVAIHLDMAESSVYRYISRVRDE